jgi:Fe-S-cluster containining protein/agmatine/peptidylarginine deiminase
MSIRLSLNVGGYRIKADVSIPPGRLRAQDMLPVYRQISDAVTQAVVAREQQAGETISCHKGCSACCKRLYVEVTEAEAYRLHDVVRALPARHRRRVESRFAFIRERLMTAGMYEDVMALQVKDEARPRLGADYFELWIECPFLEDDACSIYQERPLACREYLVTSPANECERPQHGMVQRVSFPNSAIGYAMRMTQYTSDDARLVPLALLPSWIEQNPEPVQTADGVELLMRAFGGASCNLQTALPADASVKNSSDMPADAVESSRGHVILPDYHPPDALMVPHYGIAPIELMQDIAVVAARSIGVILLTPDPERTRAFVAQQPDPERFSILVAASDTAWIRDRAPIAVRDKDENIQWYLPCMPKDDREADAGLFDSICAHPSHPSPVTLASGNLVTGPAGVALSTRQVLEQNNDGGVQGFQVHARQLGIHRWIVFPPFTKEMTHHADVHVRFLAEDLAAVAWNLSAEKDREIANDIAALLVDTLPGLRILKIPIRSDNERYASTLNWIQLGKDLIVPRFELNQEDDLAQTRQLLESEGFRPVFVDSPTLDTGGSLHCLTASVYLQ